MQLLKLKPVLYSCPDFGAFVDEFKVTDRDLILSNDYIMAPQLEKTLCEATVINLEDYGSGEPSDVMINALLEHVSTYDYDRLIAIGGGSVLDIAKIVAVAGQETDVNKLYDQPLVKHHQLIAVPATCGTGSEVTNIAVVNRTVLGTKQGLVGEALYPDAAVIVPSFLETLPYEVFATSSIDALIHAIESYLSPKATPFTQTFSVDAMSAILNAYLLVREDHEAYKQLGQVLLQASTSAGIAFGNAGCGLIHAMSYAFGGKYHVPHGESNYQFLMKVLHFYRLKQPEAFQEFSDMLGEMLNALDPLAALEDLLNEILPYKPMRSYGAIASDPATFAKSTVAHQQRLLANAFFKVDEQEIRELYESCL
ncbi:MAG: iron-containing alcohol dehydrogenase [Intestinibaculum porci]|uniref:iron-containing alcohol dehydrogenase n=1 Tax=Intestinibaculum porci TaxID=2487118 RepID=UPI003F0D54F5